MTNITISISNTSSSI